MVLGWFWDGFGIVLGGFWSLPGLPHPRASRVPDSRVDAVSMLGTVNHHAPAVKRGRVSVPIKSGTLRVVTRHAE